jgi:fructose-1,6-bisphosphatase/inositol monophosphatase family enzyme
LGIIDLPALDERYVGWTGAGCHRNGRRVRVSDRTDPTQCLASTGDRVCFEWSGRQAGLKRMTADLPLLRTYTDAFGHSMVLSGAVDVMVDCDLNPWDAAATQILAVEAGGACVSLTSARNKLDLIFGNPALVERVAEFFEADH